MVSNRDRDWFIHGVETIGWWITTRQRLLKPTLPVLSGSCALANVFVTLETGH
jgi:hypothetical protein